MNRESIRRQVNQIHYELLEVMKIVKQGDISPNDMDDLYGMVCFLKENLEEENLRDKVEESLIKLGIPHKNKNFDCLMEVLIRALDYPKGIELNIKDIEQHVAKKMNLTYKNVETITRRCILVSMPTRVRRQLMEQFYGRLTTKIFIQWFIQNYERI